MIYLDTSFLTPLFREEATSSKVAAFLARQSVGTLAVSKWTSVEFASLISRDVRMGTLRDARRGASRVARMSASRVARIGALTVAQGRKLIAEFDAMVADALVVLTPTANDFTLAQQYVANFSTKLRAPDALHLAVAHNNDAEFVATLDEGMLFVAKKLKVAARRVIR